MRRLVHKFTQYSQLKKNVLSGTVFSVCNTVITLISYPIYLNYLGAEKYGLWSIVAVIFSFSQFGQMGTDIAITKYVANEYGKGNYRGVTEYIYTAFCILLVPSLIVLLLLFFFKSEIADFIKLEEVFRRDGVRLMLCVGVLSVFSFFVNLLKGLVAGIGRMDIANYAFLAGRILQIIVAIILLMSGMGIWSLYYGFLIYFLAPSIIWFIILKKIYHIKFFEFGAFNRQKMKELLNYGGTLMAGIIAQMFVIPFNKIIIGRYIGLSEVTYYSIAVKVIMSVRGLFVKGLESILPKISEVNGRYRNSFASVISIHKKGMKFIFLFALPLYIVMFIFVDPALRLWLGSQFNVQMTTILKILLVGWLLNALAVPDYFMFLGIGKVGYSVSATCIRGISNALFISILIVMGLNISLNTVVVIEAVSIVMAMIFLKFKYFEFKKLNRALQH